MSLVRAAAAAPGARHRFGGRARAAAWAAFVAAGFLFQGLIPGLDLALRGQGLPFGLGLSTGICHTPLAGADERNTAALPGEESEAPDHGCCLVCQAASTTKGASPSPTFKVPTAGTAGLRFVAHASTRMDGPASRSRFPRGPPAFASA